MTQKLKIYLQEGSGIQKLPEVARMRYRMGGMGSYGKTTRYAHLRKHRRQPLASLDGKQLNAFLKRGFRVRSANPDIYVQV